ncbi:hypothetical protein AAG570_009579 [Ranatra chinensis]|uniref:Uncharacterized protein n=1 Tax=Ranatra chinensis TaxID=642074 RepID=A0ABD0YPH4_9HEMI
MPEASARPAQLPLGLMTWLLRLGWRLSAPVLVMSAVLLTPTLPRWSLFARRSFSFDRGPLPLFTGGPRVVLVVVHYGDRRLQGRVVLLLSEAENASAPQTMWKYPEFKAAVEDSIKREDRYIVIKQFKEGGVANEESGDDTSSKVDEPKEDYWTTSREPVDVPPGNYSVAIVALARYCHLYTATSLISLPFSLQSN